MAGQSKKQKLVTETFLLEPILTPSGIVDYADDSTTVSLLASEHLTEHFTSQSSDSFETAELEQSWQVGEAEPLLDGISEPLAGPDVPTSDSLASEQLQELSFIELSTEVNDNLELNTSDATAGDDPEEVSVLPLSPPREVDANNNLETGSDNLSKNDVNNGPEVEVFEATSESNSEEALSSQINSSSELTPSEIIVVDDPTIAVDDFPSLDPSLDLTSPSYTFDSGVFTVGESGQVGIDFLFDGGKYQGEVAIFSLEGMEGFEPGSTEFIQEAARRALSNSELGHVIISDGAEGARFSAELGEQNWNSGDYLGVKSFTMNPGDEFAVMLVPNGSVEYLLTNPTAGGSRTPLFSLGTANPADSFHVGQIVDVTGEGNTFVMEDFRMDKGSDRDYNDLIFQVRGATGKAASIDEYIAPAKDWRTSDMGQALVEYTKPYINSDDPIDLVSPVSEEPALVSSTADPTQLDIDDLESESNIPDAVLTPAIATDSWEFPIEDQPLIGIIDTGFSANNPDIDYSKILLGRDRVDGDADPLLQAGEGNEHGTHVLGIISATQGNGIGIDGINDEANIWVGRAIGSGEWAESLVEFVDQVRISEQPTAIANLSLDLTQINPDGTITTRYELTPQERSAIEYARQHNVLLVAAAGNDGNVMSALGQASQEFDNIITVGAAERVNSSLASSQSFVRSHYSSYGAGLDIVAPGGTMSNPVLSTANDGIAAMSGTSVATAKVTGVASQVWAANPQLNYRQVIEILKATATDLAASNWDGQTGAGLLNLAAAIHLAKATPPQLYEIPSTLIPETWSGAGRVISSERAVATEFLGKHYEWESYITRRGDTLSQIALRTMGNGTAPYYNFIAQQNGITNPSLIYENTRILIPREVFPSTVGSQPDLNKTIGYDGTSVHQTYINTFNRNGGLVVLGSPSNKVHPWSGGYMQNLSGGTEGFGGIMKSNANDNSYWVGSSFWSKYLDTGGAEGPLQYPISDRYAINGGQRQDFQGGAIIQTSRGIFSLFGGIGGYYLQNGGGHNERLGLPISGEIGIGNGVIIQNFENGRIVYGDGPTRVEINGQPETQSPNNPPPQVPINANSPNYRDGSVNPFAYRFQEQCTWYAYGRMLETGLLPADAKQNGWFLGNAWLWRRDAERAGLPITPTPTPGSRGLVVWPPGVQGGHSAYGHVAFLEEVYPDGRIRISESNWAGQNIKERILTPAQYKGLDFVRLEHAVSTPRFVSPPAQPGQTREYRVRPGDSLWAIAQRELGDGNRWRDIKKPDGNFFTEVEARNLQVGMSVYLPVSSQSGTGQPVVTPPTTPTIVQPPISNSRTYTIRSGDSLWLIAQRELGNGSRWREIKKPDSNSFTEAEARNLRVGQIIYLPGGSSSNSNPPAPPGTEQPANFLRSLNFVLRWEGGYSNHPNDPGGSTNRGITQGTYNGYRQDKGLPFQDVRQISQAEVNDIYLTRYWQASGSHQLSAQLATVHFDAAVNMGVGGASSLLAATRQSSSDDEMSLVTRYLQLREAKYRAIVANQPSMGVFLRGWFNRLNSLAQEVGASIRFAA